MISTALGRLLASITRAQVSQSSEQRTAHTGSLTRVIDAGSDVASSDVRLGSAHVDVRGRRGRVR